MILFVLGNVANDSLYYVNKYPKSGETILAKKVLKDIGGKGFNQAVAARRTGVNVSFWTCTGSDEVSEKILKILEKEEILTNSILRQDAHADESIIIINSDGRNYIVSNCQNSESIDQNYVKIMFNSMKEGDALLIQGNLKEDVTHFCAFKAFKKKIKVFLNASPISFDYPKILPYVETLIVNESENKKLSNSKKIEIGNKILLEMGVSNVITTKGDRGLIYSSRNNEFSFKADKVDVVDTTGAGDVFCGTLAAYICLGNNYKDSCLKSMNLASLSVKKCGTYLSIPSKKFVNSIKN